MTDTTPVRRDPPVSPHVQLDGHVWRWHVTMATSILHRATGVALYGGALILAAWALALALGPQVYNGYMALLGSIPGKIVIFGLTFSLVYHLINGVRHLVWDTGQGLDIHTASLTSWFVVGASALLTVLIWVLAFMMGAL